MPEAPVFSSEDRVTNDLPSELRGVTDPVKIAQYYQRRETALRQELARPPASTPPPTSVTITRPTTEPVKSNIPITQEEADASRVTLVETARQTAKAGKKYWDKYAKEINEIMDSCPIETRLNFTSWEVAYNTVIGMNYDKIQADERAASEQAVRLAAERSSTTTPNDTPPPPLPDKVVSKVLPGLGISEETYRTAQDRMVAGEWPLTAENVNGQRKTIGGK